MTTALLTNARDLMQSWLQNSFASGADGIAHSPARLRAALCILIVLHISLCCLSLVKVSEHQSYMPFDRHHLSAALALASAFSLVALPFLFARFSFGYFVGFYLYTLVLGFLWLSRFTQFHYDTDLAAASAAASAMLFLLPALLIRQPFAQVVLLSRRGLERLLAAILVLTVVTILAASFYNFKLISLERIYEFREEVLFPPVIRYPVSFVPGALLPFAFASCVALRSYRMAGFAFLLFLLFYPITLSKTAFFAPAWILILLLATRIFEARITVILSVLAPMLAGVILAFLWTDPGPNSRFFFYFNLVNIRMLATPASALDFYNDFFAHHPLTHFCQISILHAFSGCPYSEPLGVVMENAYHIGNLNASLFATEGIASVGPYWAPLAALACGLVIAIGNKVSSGLPARFVLVSGALVPQQLLNIPLSVTIVSSGVGLLFLLWYVTPRTIFSEK